MSRVAWFITMFFLASAFARAASATVPGLSNELEDAFWRIASVEFKLSPRRFYHENIFPRGDDGSDVSITFKNGQISGNFGCKRFSGNYTFSQNTVQIHIDQNRISTSISSDDKTMPCSIHLQRDIEELITALNSVIGIERAGDDAFNLFDEQNSYSVRLELLNPGSDLSEFRYSFWRLLSLNGNSLDDINAEVEIKEQTIDVSRGKHLLSFPFHYRLKKFLFFDPWKMSGCDGTGHVDLPSEINFKQSLQNCRSDPFLATFEQTLRKMVSYTVRGDELAVLDQSGQQILLLKRIPPTGLEYRFWHIAAYRTDWGVRRTFSRQFQVVTFLRGKMEGTAGCGALEGTYQLAGKTLKVKAGHILAGLCYPEDENENGLVLSALNKTSHMKEDATRILLQDEQGKTNIVLTPYSRQSPR